MKQTDEILVDNINGDSKFLISTYPAINLINHPIIVTVSNKVTGQVISEFVSSMVIFERNQVQNSSFEIFLKKGVFLVSLRFITKTDFVDYFKISKL
jgi:hypothetical protein